jgi:hypothetical protein
VAAAAILGAYAVPYQRARQVVGDRPEGEVVRYSGGWSSYVLSPPTSRLWGWTSEASESEKWLFPGLVGSALAVSAVATPAAPWTAALAVTVLAGADASRGSSGVVYPVFRRLLPPYQGLRVPPRFGMLVLTGLALLAAIGCGTMARTLGVRRGAGVLASLILTLMVVESAAVITVRAMPHKAPPIYRFLGTLPPTVIAHAPLPNPSRLPGFDADFIYFAQYHRHRIINGNSGFFPPSYVTLLERAWNLPSDQAIGALRDAGVEYLLVHERYFSTPAALGATVFQLERRDDLQPVGTYADEPGHGNVRVYRLRR